MKKQGFSLIEILVGVGLFSVLTVIVTTLMISSIRTSRKAAAVAVAKNEGAYALRAMEEQIRYAADVNCTAGGNSIDLHKIGTNQLITYSLDTSSHQIASSSSHLTSGDVTVDQGGCPYIFDCTPNSVSICFTVDNANGMDVTDKAGINGIMFQSLVKLLNTNQ
jgi:prepilin-type N-terminal cleavage/methylation domain-containing protein